MFLITEKELFWDKKTQRQDILHFTNMENEVGEREKVIRSIGHIYGW